MMIGRKEIVAMKQTAHMARCAARRGDMESSVYTRGRRRRRAYHSGRPGQEIHTIHECVRHDDDGHVLVTYITILCPIQNKTNQAY
jgi:hypothetical protein